MITLFDIPSIEPTECYSINLFKVRLSLNYKQLEYATEWVEYPDIAGVYHKLGAAAPESNADGTPYYCLPLIHDAATGAVVADSLAIAVYLDKTYPGTARLFPDIAPDDLPAVTGPGAAQDLSTGPLAKYHAFIADTLRARVLVPAYPLILTDARLVLTPRSRAHFSRARATDSLPPAYSGVTTLEDVTFTPQERAEVWAGLEERMHAVLFGMYGGAAGLRLFLGAQVSFADIVLASALLWLRRIYGAQSAEWARVGTWDGGRWFELLDALKDCTARLAH